MSHAPFSRTQQDAVRPSRLGRWPAASAAFVVVAGCTPSLPFHFAETADVLRADQVQVTGYGGGGGTATSANSQGSGSGGTCCGTYGGGARGRLGLGGDQEVGAEGTFFDDGRQVAYVAAKGEWKLKLIDGVALVFGAGAGWIQNAPANVGVDGAIVVSTSNARPYVLYSGARLGAATLFDKDFRDNGGTTATAVIPIGIAYMPNSRVRAYLEGGAIGAWNLGYNYGVTEKQPLDSYYVSFYGVLGVAYIFGGEDR